MQIESFEQIEARDRADSPAIKLPEPKTFVRVSLIVRAMASQTSLKVKPGVSVIGRDSECVLRPKIDSVGGRHCAITCTETQAWVEDLGSSTGTRLNRELLQPGRKYLLNNKDRIRIGDFKFGIVIKEVDAPWGPSTRKADSLKASNDSALDNLLDFDTPVLTETDTPAAPEIEIPLDVDVLEIVAQMNDSATRGVLEEEGSQEEDAGDPISFEEGPAGSSDDSALGDLLMAMDAEEQANRISSLKTKNLGTHAQREASDDVVFANENSQFEATSATKAVTAPADSADLQTAPPAKSKAKKPKLADEEREQRDRDETKRRKKQEKQRRRDQRASRPSMLLRLVPQDASTLTVLGGLLIALAGVCLVGYLVYANLILDPNAQHIMFKD